MTRCLVLNCSRTKTKSEYPVQAVERYDGPAFRVFRLFLGKADPILLDVDLYVLSAQHGLIPGNKLVDDYDQRMTLSRAAELNHQVLKQFSNYLTYGYQEVFISMSKVYLQTLNGFKSFVPQSTKVIVSNTSQGKRLSEIKRWLYRWVDEQPKVEKEIKVTGRAVLKGKVIEATPGEVIKLAQKELLNASGSPNNFRDWYTIIDGQRVSPKWLVSLLSGLCVSEFQASDARRVLSQLGISTKHV